MPKIVEALTDLEVRRLKNASPGYHIVGGVPGLYLQVTKTGAQSWILRYSYGGSRYEMGLGSYPTVTLGSARDRARELRKQAIEGTDPLAARKEARIRERIERAKAITFNQCTDAYIESQRSGWRSDKHAGQWRSSIEQYASPVIGKLPVGEIGLGHILRILEAGWETKNETFKRLRGRIEAILAWATTHGYRSGENPARWRGHLDTILPKPSKVQKKQNFPALAYHEAGAFMAALKQIDGAGARALEFAILTSTRSGEVRGATWAEIDLEHRLWVIPATRMKAEREHRVPLSNTAVALLNELPSKRNGGLLFQPPRSTGPLSDMSLTAVVRRMHDTKTQTDGIGWIDRHTDGRCVTVHGFRSTFRDWAGETTAFPREVIEHALAHRLADKAEAAYQRGDLLLKRRKLMDAWADNLRADGIAASEEKVTPIKRGVA